MKLKIEVIFFFYFDLKKMLPGSQKHDHWVICSNNINSFAHLSNRSYIDLSHNDKNNYWPKLLRIVVRNSFLTRLKTCINIVICSIFIKIIQNFTFIINYCQNFITSPISVPDFICSAHYLCTYHNTSFSMTLHVSSG